MSVTETLEHSQPLSSDNPAQGAEAFESYTAIISFQHSSGEVLTAANAEQAKAMCPELGRIAVESPKEADALIALSSMSFDKIGNSEIKPKPKPEFKETTVDKPTVSPEELAFTQQFRQPETFSLPLLDKYAEEQVLVLPSPPPIGQTQEITRAKKVDKKDTAALKNNLSIGKSNSKSAETKSNVRKQETPGRPIRTMVKAISKISNRVKPEVATTRQVREVIKDRTLITAAKEHAITKSIRSTKDRPKVPESTAIVDAELELKVVSATLPNTEGTGLDLIAETESGYVDVERLLAETGEVSFNYPRKIDTEAYIDPLNQFYEGDDQLLFSESEEFETVSIFYDEEIYKTYELLAELAQIHSESVIGNTNEANLVIEPQVEPIVTDFRDLIVGAQTEHDEEITLETILEDINLRPVLNTLIEVAKHYSPLNYEEIKGDVLFEMIADLYASIQEVSDSAECMDSQIKITPGLTNKLITIFALLGYENPHEALLSFVSDYDLDYLLKAFEYIYQALMTDGTKEILSTGLTLTSNDYGSFRIKMGRKLFMLIYRFNVEFLHSAAEIR
jgi:hypothetical protein